MPVTQASKEIGVRQTWENVTSSRSVGVTYTNTTGKPIQVNVSVNSGTTWGYANMLINGSQVNRVLWTHNMGSISSGVLLTAVIPNGATYSITFENWGGGVNMWWELR